VQIHRHPTTTHQQHDLAEHEQTASGTHSEVAAEAAAAHTGPSVENHLHLWLPRSVIVGQSCLEIALSLCSVTESCDVCTVILHLVAELYV